MISRAPFTPGSVKGEMAVLKRGLLEIFSLAPTARRHAAPALATRGLFFIYFFFFNLFFPSGELPRWCKPAHYCRSMGLFLSGILAISHLIAV